MAVKAETLNLDNANQTGRDERPVFLHSLFDADESAELFRLTALELADDLRNDPDSQLSNVRRQSIENYVGKVSTILKETKFSALAIKLSSEGSQLRYSNIEPVTEDYTQSAVDGLTILEIPSHRITGRKSLPYPSTKDDYRPMLNLRVQTSSDKPILVYTGPNEKSEIPSPGRWVKLPFEMIELATIL